MITPIFRSFYIGRLLLGHIIPVDRPHGRCIGMHISRGGDGGWGHDVWTLVFRHMLSALDCPDFWSLVHMLCGREMGTPAILIVFLFVL